MISIVEFGGWNNWQCSYVLPPPRGIRHLLHLPLLTQQYQYSTRARGRGHLPPSMVKIALVLPMRGVSVEEELLAEMMFASSQLKAANVLMSLDSLTLTLMVVDGMLLQH